VVVVGGGFSGIAAAKELYESGVDFLLIEGNDRIGGRVWHKDLSGTTVEMGANWIHKPFSAEENAPNNTLWYLKEQFNMKGGFTSWDDFELYQEDGAKVEDTALTAPYMATMASRNSCKKDLNLENDLSLGECIDQTDMYARLDEGF
jgi:polyamine oxidase